MRLFILLHTACSILPTILCLAITSGAPCLARYPKSVHLIPVGNVEGGLLNELAQSLRDKLGITAEVGKPIEIPKATFDRGRNQYHSTRILQGLETTRPHGAVPLLLAVTEVDLFVPTLNFVFGEALPTKDMAIIS
ncbi:MAG: hypothetical protein ACK4WF_01375, partial [Candidatus Brocadiales bacterium]